MIGAIIPALEALGIAFEEIEAASIGAAGLAKAGALEESGAVGEIAKDIGPSIKVPVSSSAISSVAYTPDIEGDGVVGTMTVNMQDGTSTEYYDVAATTFIEFVSASSPGTYYNKYVRLSR